MLTKRLVYFFMILHIKYYVAAQSDYNTGLTFVMDNTLSIGDNIVQVINVAQDILDTVLNTNSSQIENFGLITFNDVDLGNGAPSPVIQAQTITKDSNKFRSILSSITLTNNLNVDWSEYLIVSIIRALEESLPASYVYVFTDATPEDYQRVEEVKSLAQHKSSQVVFVLTGDCSAPEDAPEYEAYYQIARASNGAVFNLKKQDKTQILDYVKMTMEGRRTSFPRTPVLPLGSYINYTITASPSLSQSNISEVKDIDPFITIEGGKSVNIGYNERLQLICKVRGYVKPRIVWKNKEKGFTLFGKESIINHPYYYVNVLTIEKVKEDATYICEASYRSGFASVQQTVVVQTKQESHYFKVLDTPKRVIIEHDQSGQLHCLVNAYPPAEITWYKNGRKLSSGGNIELSEDNTTVTIKHASPSDRGTYVCQAKNEATSTIAIKYVSIIGLITEGPSIDKSINEVVVKKGSTAFVECKILKGNPKPSISWSYEADDDYIEVEKWEDMDIIVIENAGSNHSGKYRCQAENDLSTDVHEILLTVMQPPTIEEDKDFIRAVSGTDVSINCNVAGDPEPYTTWFKDGEEIINSDDIRIYGNQTLKIAVTLSAIGTYTCLASNRFGTANRTVVVDVIVPVSITPPANSVLSVLSGSLVTLPCEATGVPEPALKWVYNSFDYITHSRKVIKTYEEGVLHLERIRENQSGIYTCIATNSGRSESISYSVQVFGAPVIENTYADKHFVAVEGDPALRITCKATGNPKPTITWRKDGRNLVFGSTYYEEDGTLIIKTVPKDATGVYTCEASNVIGSDVESALEVYEVTVVDSPTVGHATVFLAIEEGKPAKIKCGVPHEKNDQLRWFQGGELIRNGELTLYYPKLSDSGLYICRVGDIYKSVSEYIRIDVGYKPTFVTDEVLEIQMFEESPVTLNCDTRSEPKPDISWYRDGVRLNEMTSTLHFPRGFNNPVAYKCQVENNFGSISRIFKAVSRDCPINTATLTKLQPLMLTTQLNWPDFVNVNNFIIIPRTEYIVLFCQNGFQMFPQKHISAFCSNGMNLLINGEKHDYADIKCNEEVTHVVKRTRENCMPGNTERVKIAYKTFGDMTTEVYEVCMDNTNNVPLYAVHAMKRSLAGKDYETTWSDSDNFPVNYEDLYNRKVQSNMLSDEFHTTDKCCFAKRQLVNPRDVFPGVAQRSTYSYLNVLPHWGTCNGDNFDEIERRIRHFAKYSIGQLLVWTGGAKELALDSRINGTKNDYFTDQRGNGQPIPLFLWKVVQDPISKSSLAIIQVNAPGLTPSEVGGYTLCPDVCGNTDWMNNPKWQDVDRGYTYCCSLPEFEKAFGYGGVFNPNMTDILSSGAGLPDYNLVI